MSTPKSSPPPGSRQPRPPRGSARPGSKRQGAPPRAERAAPFGAPSPQRQRKSLSNLGGATRFDGDRAYKPLIEEALDVPETPEAARYLTHAFHAWPARLHPHTARVLVQGIARERRLVRGTFADPFMGGGTVLVEAMLGGHHALGTDLNPIALEVAWVRTRAFSPRFLDALEGRLRPILKEAREIRASWPVDRRLEERVGRSFDPPVLAELWSLNAALGARLEQRPDDAVARLVRAALSSIVVKVSRQVSDSVARNEGYPQGGTRRAHGPGTAERWLGARLHELTGQLRAFAATLPEGTPEARPFVADARQPPSELATLPKVDAIISSPPYLGVYDYLQHHLLRCAILGVDARAFSEGEVGSRREQRRVGQGVALERYRRDLAAVLAGWRPRMNKDGLAALMIGDAQSGDRIVPVLPVVEAAAAASGWRICASGSQPRPAFIPGQKRPGRKEEHLVLLSVASGGPPPTARRGS